MSHLFDSFLKVIFVLDQMLDAGFCLPAIASRSGEAGGDTGYMKVNIFFYPASSIQYLPTMT
jgi:hypothetical protein